MLNGWEIKYNKFLVNFHEITIKDADGNVGYKLAKPIFFDNTKKGATGDKVIDSIMLDAKAWTDVSYQIKPAVQDETIGEGADPADHAMMVQNGYSVYVDATADGRPQRTAPRRSRRTSGASRRRRSTRSASKQRTRRTCSASSSPTAAPTRRRLTTHGDHLYYDRLQASPDPAKKTLLRFDEKAQADDAPNGDGNGDITLAGALQAAVRGRQVRSVRARRRHRR